MTRLALVIDTFAADFLAHYQSRLRPEHYQALRAMRRCRTSASPMLKQQCSACPQQIIVPHSCGHRQRTPALAVPLLWCADEHPENADSILADNTQHSRNAGPDPDHCDHQRGALRRYVNSTRQHPDISVRKLRQAPD